MVRAAALYPLLALLSGLIASKLWASVPSSLAKDSALASQLTAIRGRIVGLQDTLISSARGEKQAGVNLGKIHLLMKLQKEERAIGQRRQAQLEATVTELEARQKDLSGRIQAQRAAARRFLKSLDGSVHEPPRFLEGKAESQERLETPRRKALANLVTRTFRELEVLKVDLQDASELERRIQEEKQELANLFQDLDEQESVLELNRQLQVDLIKKNRDERLAQLESYRNLKDSELQVERLIGDFNARKELEKSIEQEREAAREQVKREEDARAEGLPSLPPFLMSKGKLPLPLEGGQVISAFGRAYDPGSRLHVFRKGVEISAPGPKKAVLAIYSGKVAFSGELAEYGRVTIIDHGDHYYSLCAHLGVLSLKAGDPVKVGDSIGVTDESGTPLYFEIRSRNVAVNPAQWLALGSPL